MFHSWRLWNLCWLQNFGVSPRALAMKPNARAQQVQADTEKRAHNLDLKYPGSTFTQVLKSHGNDGRYLVLVVGPFANLSDDSIVLWDLSLLGRARALKAIYSWNISAMHALAINRHILVSQFGHLASLVWTPSWFSVVFVMRCCPIFLDFLLVPMITLMHFSLIGDIAVDIIPGA